MEPQMGHIFLGGKITLYSYFTIEKWITLESPRLQNSNDISIFFFCGGKREKINKMLLDFMELLKISSEY